MPKQTEIRTASVVILDNGSVMADFILERLNYGSFIVLPEPNMQAFHVRRTSIADDLIHLSPDLVVLIEDVPDPDFENTVIEQCRRENVRILPILGRGATVLVGPLEVPGKLGCVTCMQMRWDHSIRRRVLTEALKRQFGGANRARTSLAFDPKELVTLAGIAAREIEAILDAKCIQTEGTVGQFRRSKPMEWVRLVPSSTCARCSPMLSDTSENAMISFQSHFIEDLDTLRVNKLDFDDIQSLYVHPELGYISAADDLCNDGYVRSSAEIHIAFETKNHVGYGSGFFVPEAKTKAILEVVERVCAVRATNRRPSVFGSYAQVREFAINPLQFGLHDTDIYETGLDSLTPFNDEHNYSWVWAYSTSSNKPILIPEQIAYYGPTSDATRFVLESSNGCSLGGTLEEAILFGIFEVLERDGFLNMWYGTLPVPELLVGDNCPEHIKRSLRRFAVEGYDVRLFNISHDMAIPAIFAVAIGPEDAVPRVVCGSSCHLNPYEAVDGALRELLVQVLHLKGISAERREEGRAMLQDPWEIKDILDHVVAAGMPEAYPRWRFLLEEGRRWQPEHIDAAYSGVDSRFQVGSRDIRVILTSVLQELHDKGFDVIVVNLTNTEAAYGGLHVVKVIIPGMTPITFGHGNRRVQGLSRVFELPYRLGYSPTVLGIDDLNKDPHPFA